MIVRTKKLKTEHPGGELGKPHHIAGDNAEEQDAKAGES